MKTFSDRMRAIRRALGARGDRTSSSAFARELGTSRHALKTWETRTTHPRITVQELSVLFERVATVKSRRFEPRALAAWAITGEGESPLGGAVVPSVSPTIPAMPTPAQGEAKSPVDPELVIDKAIEALERGDDALGLLRFARDAIRTSRETLRQAKQMGLACLVGGLTSALLGLPSDRTRDNAKLIREELADWATRELGPKRRRRPRPA